MIYGAAAATTGPEPKVFDKGLTLLKIMTFAIQR
jgi:hypothetical protein